MYHDIGDYESPWCLSSENFREQMFYLKEQGYNTISLKELEKGVLENKETEEKLLVITFDDGREGVYSNAYPILKEFGFTSTLAIVPLWINQGKTEDDFNCMSWENVKELKNNGFEIISHSYSHKNLLNLNDKEREEEFLLSKSVIEERLHIQVHFFCYPYGKFSKKIQDQCSKFYKKSITTEKGFSKNNNLYSRQWILNNTHLETFKKLLKKPIISAALIVKNEENYLAQCLSSINNIVDEIIIVDTGSEDKTKEIASKFTNKIHDFTWKNDFSSARNFSIKKCKGDWIFVLDADEIILDREYNKILESVNNWHIQAYNIMTKNYSNNSKITAWQAFKDNKNALGWYPSFKLRLFQNNQKIKFKGKVHELINESVTGRIETLNISVEHFGSLDEEKLKKKTELYLELNKAELRENPSNAKALFEIGVQYKNLLKYKKAEEYFEKSLKIKHSLLALFNLAVVKEKQNKLNEAIDDYNKVLSEKNLPEAHFGIAYSYFKKNETDKAIEEFQKAILLRPNYLEALLNLGALYERKKEYKKAAKNLMQAYKINPKEARIFYNLAVLHEKTQNLKKAINCYEKALSLGYKNKDKISKQIKIIKEFIQKNKF